MALASVVCISRKIVPELWKVVLAEAPRGWTIEYVAPADGEAKIVQAVADARYIITFSSGPVPFKIFEPLKELRLVQTAGQGTDHLPVKKLWDKGVYV